ncbi:MAG: phosphohistidine phosphatase SixA [Chthoniobacterales bacterium]
MMVLFLRHADAEDARSSDFDRKLTPKGLEQSEKVGKFCARNGLKPDVILASPLVRAQETAHGVSKKLGDVEIITENALACGMTPESCVDLLRGYQKFGMVMLVGHEPDFGECIAHLSGMKNSSQICVRKASLTAIDLANNFNAGVLEFFMPSRLM